MSTRAKQTPEEFLASLAFGVPLSPADKRVNCTFALERSAQFDDVSEGDVFEAFYGDAGGQDYWRGWLTNDVSPLYLFARSRTH